MEEGDRGFFILYRYEENDSIEENGKVLFLSDLAEYGFGDSMRFAFLDKKEEIVYSKSFYTDLQKADDLSDVRKYILSKIEK